MKFDSFQAFIDMGGYGFYVWLSYGVSLLLLAILVFSSIQSHKNIQKLILQKQKRERKRREASLLQQEEYSSPEVSKV